MGCNTSKVEVADSESTQIAFAAPTAKRNDNNLRATNELTALVKNEQNTDMKTMANKPYNACAPNEKEAYRQKNQLYYQHAVTANKKNSHRSTSKSDSISESFTGTAARRQGGQLDALKNAAVLQQSVGFGFSPYNNPAGQMVYNNPAAAQMAYNQMYQPQMQQGQQYDEQQGDMDLKEAEGYDYDYGHDGYDGYDYYGYE